MFDLATWEMLSYVVTVIGLPLAILVFILERRKERENDEEEVYQLLSDNYQDFLKVALENSELALFSSELTQDLTPQQREKMFIIFSMLVSLFERAYLLLHEGRMSAIQKRRWRTWEDYMREWCARPDFANLLPTLLQDEDPEFVAYIEELATAPHTPAVSPIAQLRRERSPSLMAGIDLLIHRKD
ncbi:MAG TPA: hypothetical protein VGB55_15890 [Tepidisphaeraceae bacterium]|jgi:hypothetical protein